MVSQEATTPMSKISDLTERAAVLAAISEYDQLGQESFLKKYGFGKSTKFILRHEGREYDSKAIAAVAFGLQFTDKEFLGSHDLHGGIRPREAAGRLMDLSFEIVGLDGRSIRRS
jgi:hypothetical protein